jgi:hypothetical protein
MKFSRLFVALLFIFTVAATSFAADANEVSAIAAVVKKHVSKEIVENVYVEKMIGDYAAAIVSVKDGDGGIAYLKKSGDTWSVLHYDNHITEDVLKAVGIPADIAKKFSE